MARTGENAGLSTYSPKLECSLPPGAVATCFEFGIRPPSPDAPMRKVSNEDMTAPDEPPALEWQRSRTPRSAMQKKGRADFAMSERPSQVAEEATSAGESGAEVSTSSSSQTSPKRALENIQPDFVDAILGSSELLDYHADTLFRSYDANKVGSLTAADLRDFLPDLFVQLGLPKEHLSPVAFLELFATSDVDRDGVLVMEEFKAFLSSSLQRAKAAPPKPSAPDTGAEASPEVVRVPSLSDDL